MQKTLCNVFIGAYMHTFWTYRRKQRNSAAGFLPQNEMCTHRNDRSNRTTALLPSYATQDLGNKSLVRTI